MAWCIALTVMVQGQAAATERLSAEAGARDKAVAELRAALEAAQTAAAQERARLAKQLEQQQAQSRQLQDRLSQAAAGTSAAEVCGVVMHARVCLVPACMLGAERCNYSLDAAVLALLPASTHQRDRVVGACRRRAQLRTQTWRARRRSWP